MNGDTARAGAVRGDYMVSPGTLACGCDVRPTRQGGAVRGGRWSPEGTESSRAPVMSARADGRRVRERDVTGIQSVLVTPSRRLSQGETRGVQVQHGLERHLRRGHPEGE